MISREAVLKKIDYEVEHYCKYLEEVDDKRNAQTHVALVSDNIREEVEQLPSVTHKSGKWQRVSIEKYIQHAMAYYVCSECGGQTIGEPKYCPNCGAHMIEPQESEDK